MEKSLNHPEKDTNQLVKEAIQSGRVTVKRPSRDIYPDIAQRAINSFTEQKIVDYIKQIDFGKTEALYLVTKGPNGLSFSTHHKNSIGVIRRVTMVINEGVEVEGVGYLVKLDCSLIQTFNDSPQILAELRASKPEINPERNSDGSCVNCSGIGCWDCGYSGGY